MIIGELTFAAVSIAAFIVFEPVTLAAGRAKPSAFARAKTSFTSLPTITPGAKSRRSVLMAPMLLAGAPTAAGRIGPPVHPGDVEAQAGRSVVGCSR